MTIAYLNGDFAPLAEVRISPMDRGFLFGDGVYEVIPCYDGKMVALQYHLERLDQSLDGIALLQPHSDEQLINILEKSWRVTAPAISESICKLPEGWWKSANTPFLSILCRRSSLTPLTSVHPLTDHSRQPPAFAQ
jgi:hypothetical protein